MHILALLQLLAALVAQQGGSASGSSGPTLAFRDPRADTLAAVPPAARTVVAADITPAPQAASMLPEQNSGDASSASAAGTAADPSPLQVRRQGALKQSQGATEALATLVTGLPKAQELLSRHPSAQVTCSSVARLMPDLPWTLEH